MTEYSDGWTDEDIKSAFNHGWWWGIAGGIVTTLVILGGLVVAGIQTGY